MNGHAEKLTTALNGHTVNGHAGNGSIHVKRKSDVPQRFETLQLHAGALRRTPIIAAMAAMVVDYIIPRCRAGSIYEVACGPDLRHRFIYL
jgi:Flp pilus assembly CpaF family ATPase